MTVRRIPFRSGVLLSGLGLCLALALALPRPAFDRSESARFTAWANATLFNVTADIERLLAFGGRSGSVTPQQSSSPPIDRAAALGLNISGLREALPFYKAGELAEGDAEAKAATDPIVRTTLEWVALRSTRDIEPARLQAFLDAHPTWPARGFIMRRIDEELYASQTDAKRVEDYYAHSPPQTVLGKLALARALLSQGESAEAQELVRAVWRNADLGPALETRVKSEFGTYLTSADHKARADRLLYEGEADAGLRAAALAGRPVVALAKLRLAVSAEVANDKMFAAIPAAMQSDPAYLFAKIQKLRRADKVKDAAALMLSAPRDPALLVDGDAWWIERRIIARKLLDLNDPAFAYRICAEHAAESDEAKIDAEFHAGWIALRFLNDPALAAKHFDAAALLAQTPISIARIAYWQGRAAEISPGDDADARSKAYYERAAAQVATYYGQLARERLQLKPIALRSIGSPATGAARDQSVRAVELLYALGENDLALNLAVDAAQHLTSDSQLAALANVVASQHDAHASLVVGKMLAQRQIAADSLAFPTYGIPSFAPVENSAPPAVLYAVARQESGFDSHAVSSAGAKGLMQMIDSTAKRTAERAGIDFDAAKLTSDASFNARLAAAHLGELFAEQGGSPILVFAAYNAGGRRVKEWIEAYGDPRTPGVDPIDWVERIPFEETRNYVQRVMENWAMYRASFTHTATAARETPVTNAAKL